MPASKAKQLSSLFRSAVKTPADDTVLKQFVSSLDVSVSSSVAAVNQKRVKPLSPLASNTSSSEPPLSHLFITNLIGSTSDDGSIKKLSTEISSILYDDTSVDFNGSADSTTYNDNKISERMLDISFFPTTTNNNISLRRKERSRERKARWVLKSTQTARFDKLVRTCGEKLGTEATIHVFGKLGRETGVKEFNALIQLCIQKARSSDDEDVSLTQIYKTYKLFEAMREQGFPLEEETYGPFLMYLIDMSMVEEVHFFCGVIRGANPNSVSRLAYYEMLIWIRVNNEAKIRELCSTVIGEDDKNKSAIRENYLLALFESDDKGQLLLLLENFDITRVSSKDHIETIFKSLGRLSLESFVEKFLLTLKTYDTAKQNISNCIFNYAIGLPNLVVKDVLSKFRDLHSNLEVKPSSVSYEKLIMYCCDLHKVHLALDLVDQVFEAGLTLSIEIFNSILNACDRSYEYNLVHKIYSVICRHDLKPNTETFKSMINMSVKMKDFDGAYSILKDLETMNLMPTIAIYNAIMAGYFREKDIGGGLRVLRQMEDANVKPDSQTFSYLILNCDCEKDIVKYYEELNHSGVQMTKNVFMALINAYASCGLFEKAKQIVLDGDVPVKNLNEIKSVLVSALASHGQISDALEIYEEIKQAGCNLEAKSIICLIEYIQSKGELSRLLQLLGEVEDLDYWIDGCCRIISYCVRHMQLSSVVGLLKQLKNKLNSDGIATEVIVNEVFCQIASIEPKDMKICIDLLQALKEELNLQPSRRSLDFLLSACVSAKDSKSAFLIWKEYQTAGLPYNVLSFVRMYQALLASGDYKSATTMLNKIPKDDPHVRCVIKECQSTYSKACQSGHSNLSSSKKKKKKKVRPEGEQRDH